MALVVAVVAAPARAEACGCVAPPEVQEGEYAVNQTAEQIIFEVEPGFITAHVLIRYAGDPAEFAWIVPVPSVPELELSEEVAFGLLDQATAPRVDMTYENACPVGPYVCNYHETVWCDGGTGSVFINQPDGGGLGGGPDGIDVKKVEQVGDYQTVVFAADDASLAVQWLQDNGFIVNPTMTPYMQPYLNGGSLFLASKLVAGAGADQIKPLKMRFASDYPMIPLQLTAVAADPHMTVTAYIYADEPYAPAIEPLVQIDESRLSQDGEFRSNYPMVLARTIDERGGLGFISEYRGAPPNITFDNDFSGCCGAGQDVCGVSGNGLCECPRDDYDQVDCQQIEGLVEGLELLDGLDAEYPVLTRLTTRLSPEDMTTDPFFVPQGGNAPLEGRLELLGSLVTVNGCEDRVVNPYALAVTEATRDCTSVYCGAGTCLAVDGGVGCACEAGFVARQFTDLDGEPSVTCVPENGPVDLGDVPDPCAGVSCGHGQCEDIGGFPTCRCDLSAAAAVSPDEDSPVPECVPILWTATGPGADNYSDFLYDLEICAPNPPDCGDQGWLVPNDTNVGTLCPGFQEPDPDDFVVPEPITCDDPPDTGATSSSGGASTAGSSAGETDTTTSASGSGGSGASSSGSDTAGMLGTRATCACTTGGGSGGGSGGGAPWMLLLPVLLRRRRG